MDLILCRNVLIYLDADAARAVAPEAPTTRWPRGMADRRLVRPAPGRPRPVRARADRTGGCSTAGRCRARGRVDGPRRAGRSTSRRPSGSTPWPGLRAAVARGDYARAVSLTRGRDDAEALALHVRALANLDVRLAERASAEATARHPLSDELRHLRAVLLLDLGREAEAAREARHAIYIDRNSAMAPLPPWARSWIRLGDRPGAWRAYRNARDLAEARPPDEPVPLSDGETAGRLGRAAPVADGPPRISRSRGGAMGPAPPPPSGPVASTGRRPMSGSNGPPRRPARRARPVARSGPRPDGREGPCPGPRPAPAAGGVGGPGGRHLHPGRRAATPSETRFIAKVVRLSDFTPVPGTPAFLGGVLNLRGEILALIDLRAFFGFAGPGLTDLSRIIVLGLERNEFGIMADAVHEVMTLGSTRCGRRRRSIPGGGRPFLLGVTVDARIVLDGAALIRDEGLYIDQGDEPPAGLGH